MKIIVLLVGTILSGILGRMGGKGKPYKSWMRDWIIPFLFLFVLHLLYQPICSIKTILIYFITYILMGFSFTTYWDWLFGYDNLWFSGFVVGLSTIPCMFHKIGHLSHIIERAVLLGIIWGCLNKYLPNKVLIWRRDVAEEFLRYASVIITIPILFL